MGATQVLDTKTMEPGSDGLNTMAKYSSPPLNPQKQRCPKEAKQVQPSSIRWYSSISALSGASIISMQPKASRETNMKNKFLVT